MYNNKKLKKMVILICLMFMLLYHNRVNCNSNEDDKRVENDVLSPMESMAQETSHISDDHIVFKAKAVDDEPIGQKSDPFFDKPAALDSVEAYDLEKQASDENYDTADKDSQVVHKQQKQHQQHQKQTYANRNGGQQQQSSRSHRQQATTQSPVQQSRVANNQVVYNQIPPAERNNPYHHSQYVMYMPESGQQQNPQLVGSERTMEQFLDRLLHESVYDRRIRPFYTDSKTSKPVDVMMNMHINTISGISEVNMEYIVDCYFRQEWHDPRLMYSNSSWKHVEDITLHYDLVNKVWTPDAFFRNSKDAKGHSITVPNKLIRIFPEGRVLFSQRLTLRLECPMKLQKFPLDNQTCTINIGSYGYTLKDIRFDWHKPQANSDPVTISSKLEMPDFILTTHNATVCQRKTSTGSYACLEVHFYLKRSFGYYLVQVYIPSVLTCFISFVSFWIDHKAVPARISVGLLTVLTVTTQSSGIRSQLPKVSYIKAIDVWMSACLVFVFAALLEYAVVNVIARKQELKKLVRMSERHKQQRKMRQYESQQKKLQHQQQQHGHGNAFNISPTTEKVLVIGNRLANLNYKKEEDLLGQSQEALDKLLHNQSGGNHIHHHGGPHHHGGSFKKTATPHSTTSLHVDSAVSISGASQQSTPPIPYPPPPAVPPPPPPSQAPPANQTPAPPPGPPRDDAQMVDFASSFLFPISFIIFNIIYWMVYLNMQVESGN